MTLTLFKYQILAVSSVIALLGIVFILSATSQPARAANPPGIPAMVASSSVFTISNVAGGTLVFATSSCLARIVTTGSSTVMMSFSDNGFNPTGTQGHLQLGSTTVAYDASVYGCGSVRMFGFQGGTVSVSETR